MYYKFYEKKVEEIIYESHERNQYYDIGTFIKNERIMLGLNQDFVCKDICSISHYSRIENNLIRPSSEHISKILKKLNKSISIHQNDDFQYKELINKMLIGVNKRDIKLLDNIYFSVSNETVINYKIYFIRLIYSVFKQDYCSCKQLIKTINYYHKILIKEEIALFLFLQGEYYYLVNQIPLSEQFLSLSYKIIDSTCLFIGRLHYIYAQVLFKLNNRIKSLFYALEAKKHFYKTYNVYYVDHTRLLIGELYLYSFEERALSIFLNLLDNNLSKDHDITRRSLFFLAKIYKNRKNVYESLYYLRQLIKISKCNFNLLIGIYHEFLDLLLENDIEITYELFNTIKESNTENNEISIYIDYFKIKVNKENDQNIKIRYLKSIISFVSQLYDSSNEIKYRKEYIDVLSAFNEYDQIIEQYKKIISLFEQQRC